MSLRLFLLGRIALVAVPVGVCLTILAVVWLGPLHRTERTNVSTGEPVSDSAEPGSPGSAESAVIVRLDQSGGIGAGPAVGWTSAQVTILDGAVLPVPGGPTIDVATLPLGETLVPGAQSAIGFDHRLGNEDGTATTVPSTNPGVNRNTSLPESMSGGSSFASIGMGGASGGSFSGAGSSGSGGSGGTSSNPPVSGSTPGTSGHPPGGSGGQPSSIPPGGPGNTPGTSSNTPGTSSNTPGTSNNTPPGTSDGTPGTSNSTPGSGTNTPGSGGAPGNTTAGPTGTPDTGGGFTPPVTTRHAVPEPGTLLVLGSALIGLAAVGRLSDP